MGEKLVGIYEAIKREGALPMAMRLAIMTGIPNPKANEAADSPENITKFAAAFKEITGKDCPIV